MNTNGCYSLQECISQNIQTGCCMVQIARQGQGPIAPPVFKEPELPVITIPDFFPENSTIPTPSPSLTHSVFTSLNQAVESVAGEDSMAKAGVVIAAVVLTAAVVFGVVKGIQYFRQKKEEPMLPLFSGQSRDGLRALV